MAGTLKATITDFFTMGSWKSKLRDAALRKKKSASSAQANAFGEKTIRLLESPGSAVTLVQRLAVEILKREGQTPLARLVDRVAREVYFDEVRRGAWALDIGLYGPGLFVRDVISEIRSGDQILWSIERPEREGNGLLPDLP